jgi:cyclic pyranopterin phosphate synthase
MFNETTLQDRFGRRIEYLRLSVTDRCDLRCTYCIPEGFHGFEEPSHWLTHDELVRVVSTFAHLGASKVRLTGGEPLLRRDIIQLTQRLGALPGIRDLSLSTNATQLSQHAQTLRQAGIARLNVSLDTLKPGRFAQITRRDSLNKVLEGLMAAKEQGFNSIKINMVVMAGINEDEVDDMVAFCIEHSFILRMIETMPMGETGRNSQFLDLQPVKQRLQQRFGLVNAVLPGGGPARYLQSSDGSFSVGFITPLSQHFCDTCNRVRLSVDGTLFMCLGQDEKLELRPLLRAGISDVELEQAIRKAIELKPLRHEFRENPGKVIRVMSLTGG